MTHLSNETISRTLERVAELLELDGANPKRVQAHRQSARVIRRCPRAIAAVADEEGVEGLHQLGLGYLMGGLVTDWLRSEDLPLLRTLEAAHHPGCQLLRVPGIGPRLAAEIKHALGVESLSQLEQVARDGRLSQVCGFGPRRIALVRSALDAMLHPEGRVSGCHPPVQLDLEMPRRAGIASSLDPEDEPELAQATPKLH
ncbi:MAG: putative polymerase family [Myxococcaceae bacterium]|nr:putative polymerase family [Myxococcaceae bacterium]